MDDVHLQCSSWTLSAGESLFCMTFNALTSLETGQESSLGMKGCASCYWTSSQTPPQYNRDLHRLWWVAQRNVPKLKDSKLEFIAATTREIHTQRFA
jgi:hypothetical protein